MTEHPTANSADTPATAALASNILNIRDRLPPHVRLVAVTKTFPASLVRQAYHAGLRDFGENRLQEALDKQDALADLPDIRWHFIGHLQGNKAKKAIERFAWIHSCDSLKLAHRLDRLAGETGARPRVLLQVKPLPDPDKYGWSVAELSRDWPQIVALPALNVSGLMTILPLGLSAPDVVSAFANVRDLAAKLRNDSGLALPELSMGMSGDYPLAIEAGATTIRLGRSLFGERLQKM
ncbi:pyridoxal phosphate enzyme, YggS family [Rubidibacter lacunae KORDI 51-2]|uniref:Pyridoxal phosphate homeostasis protein n=1 Tax=Rubidibacter lacunae KORDI 51-2 TaxID=582515 RepID=U5DRD6_9CHRO|nr:YggS family pyridoxal phosphate-dependent enzyme [Rubidibacter lacunae]ERN42260.1 pyridoxal phosphate enzyme, YggS family [Rubidibacter lacunae KORDI 51-2]